MSATKCRGVGRSWAGLNCDRWKRAFAAELLWRFCLANQLQIWCRSGRNSAQQSLPSENPPLIASCISRTSRLTLCDVRAYNRVLSTHYYTTQSTMSKQLARHVGQLNSLLKTAATASSVSAHNNYFTYVRELSHPIAREPPIVKPEEAVACVKSGESHWPPYHLARSPPRPPFHRPSGTGLPVIAALRCLQSFGYVTF